MVIRRPDNRAPLVTPLVKMHSHWNTPLHLYPNRQERSLANKVAREQNSRPHTPASWVRTRDEVFVTKQSTFSLTQNAFCSDAPASTEDCAKPGNRTSGRGSFSDLFAFSQLFNDRFFHDRHGRNVHSKPENIYV